MFKGLSYGRYIYICLVWIELSSPKRTSQIDVVFYQCSQSPILKRFCKIYCANNCAKLLQRYGTVIGTVSGTF